MSEANRAAARLLTGWRNWPGGALALIGAKGSGKTHLTLAWALETGARALGANTPSDEAAALFEETEGRLYVDDADGPRDDLMLWRVLDLARARAGAVLLVGTAAPGLWLTPVKDLRSRLAALPVARLGEPDEMLLEVILRRLCREQFIQLSEDSAKYLAKRMPRTFEAARALAAALEADWLKKARPVSVAGAKRALERVMAGQVRETE